MNLDHLTETLKRAGLSAAGADRKKTLFAQANSALPGATLAYHVPGRIEFLGKHTDYCGGRSLVCATENGFVVVASPRADKTVRVINVAGNDEATMSLDPELMPTPGVWANYPMTVARRVARNFGPNLKGADIAFISDLPPAAGLSSSSAMMIAIFLVLADVNDLWSRREYTENIKSLEDLGGYLGTIENGQTFGTLVGDRGVGTFGGSQDHTAILCSAPGKLHQYSFCPVRFEGAINLPNGTVFVVASSGVIAEKTREAMEKYNRVSLRARTIVRIWNERTGRSDATVADVLRSETDAIRKLGELLQNHPATEFDYANLARRLLQFHDESQHIIPQVGYLLAQGELAAAGDQIDQSQRGAETGLENQVPQTIELQRSARKLGAIAASAFGAGFGGSVWALVDESTA
ncbi:MAG TPA: galactokinase family protein, partial [Tepidisphaeraceae bacterium]|nr:galactokinase family protein [Tepidisphaeraceae bacterium]